MAGEIDCYFCCVPSCPNSYESNDKIQLFNFPKHPVLRHEWVQRINRKDENGKRVIPNAFDKVCALHFNKKINKDLPVQFQVPTIFPKYYSSSPKIPLSLPTNCAEVQPKTFDDIAIQTEEACFNSKEVFCNKVIGALEEMRYRNYLTDIIIKAEDTIWSAHKLILAIHSPVLNSIFEHDPYLDELFLPESATIYGSILDYFYSGRILIDKENYLYIRNTAMDLKVEELVQLCDDFEKKLSLYLNNNYNEESCPYYIDDNLSISITSDNFSNSKETKWEENSPNPIKDEAEDSSRDSLISSNEVTCNKGTFSDMVKTSSSQEYSPSITLSNFEDDECKQKSLIFPQIVNISSLASERNLDDETDDSCCQNVEELPFVRIKKEADEQIIQYKGLEMDTKNDSSSFDFKGLCSDMETDLSANCDERSFFGDSVSEISFIKIEAIDNEAKSSISCLSLEESSNNDVEIVKLMQNSLMTAHEKEIDYVAAVQRSETAEKDFIPKSADQNFDYQSSRSSRFFTCGICNRSIRGLGPMAHHVIVEHKNSIRIKPKQKVHRKRNRANIVRLNKKKALVSIFDYICSDYDNEISGTNMNSVTPEKFELQCEKCLYSTTFAISFHFHKYNYHGVPLPEHFENVAYKCLFCCFKTSISLSLKQHNLQKHQSNSLNCDKCIYYCISFDRLEFHNHMVHGGSLSKELQKTAHMCPFCSLFAPTQILYSIHINKFHQNENIPNETATVQESHDHNSNHRGKELDNSSLDEEVSESDEHKRTNYLPHNNLLLNKLSGLCLCHICGARFYNPSTLKKHIMQHENIPQLVY